MGQNLARKILGEHLVAGEMVAGKEVAIRVDQAFTHDLAVMAWQQFESMGLPRVRTELAVDYTDHNSSYEDLMAVAAILKGKTIHPSVSFTVSPGTKQVYSMIAETGALADLIAAGARILESACGPCIGMGQAPAT